MAIDAKKYNWNSNYNNNPNISDEERRTNRSKAGTQKGINSRRRRKFAEIFDELLSFTNSEGEGLDELISMELLRHALNGDMQAYQLIRDQLGEKPKDQMELTTGNSITIEIGQPEDGDQTQISEE